MCDACAAKRNSWRGWVELPSAADVGVATGSWVDLSHPIGPKTPTMPIFEPPRVERVLNLPKDPANITRFQMVVHQGTHLDAPFHMFEDGPTMSDIALDRLTGPGVVLSIQKGPFDVIDMQDFETAAVPIESGDIVFLDTGWAKHVNTSLYEEHPSLTLEAATWLVKRRVKMIGVDFATPDLSTKRRPAGFTWPVHLILLSQVVLVAEHLTNLTSVSNRRVEIVCSPLNIAGADGAPARILARPVEPRSR